MRPLNGRHRPQKPLVFLGSWAPFSPFFLFHYEAVMQHALQKVLSKRLGAGAEFVKKAELSGQTHVTHSHQTRTVQQDQIAKSLSPHAQKSPYPSPNVKISAGEKPPLFERKCHVVNSLYLFLFFFVQCCSKSHFCTPPILGIFPQRGGWLVETTKPASPHNIPRKRKRAIRLFLVEITARGRARDHPRFLTVSDTTYTVFIQQK